MKIWDKRVDWGKWWFKLNTENKNIKFYNSMLKSSDVYILAKGTITITRAGVDAATQRAD